MFRRWGPALAAVVVLVALAPSPVRARDGAPPTLLVGYGEADATWHVGAGAGQYAEKAPPSLEDPNQHSLTQADSYGVASRLSMRAIVVEGTNGERVALVKSDSYLAQDHLLRRVGTLLADAGSTLTTDRILHSASHNHSSPYYSTPSVGVWLFQDVMDLRAFEYQARAMRDAILVAEADLQPARMGATVVEHHAVKANIAGRGTSEDGTPHGYPADFGDHGLTVLRFESLDGTPIAAWMNWGQHPESLDGDDLITADYLGPLERMVERETGAPLVFTQGDVGSSEGPYLRDGYETLPDGTVRAWAHVGHAQAERGARLLADSVLEGWDRIGTGDVAVPLSSDVPVGVLTYRAPGPVSHPYPSVSNCRTSNPGVPAAGLPDCQTSDGAVSLETETLKAHGIPVPDHYDAPALGAVEENARILLQAARIGDVILGSCSCEAQVDLILNFESRADDVVGNIWDGYDWPTEVDDAAHRRMRAQVHNDALGWDDPANAVAANSEPTDPAAIWGNFTKEELGAGDGYRIAVGLGHTGDYVGYTVSYREYMSRDSYRKALTSYGPHTADYMVTRLVRMAGSLHGGVPFEPTDPTNEVTDGDEARQQALSTALGQASAAALDGWAATLPPDIGPFEILDQPDPIRRFDAATVTWRGRNAYVDNPTVGVDRLVDGEWQPFADQSGEVQTMLTFPEPGGEWRWTASFEAFDGFPASMGQVPNGTYRFVIDGADYELVSEPFDVGPWAGITVSDLAVVDGDVSFTVDPIAYPRTYESPFGYVADDGSPVLCTTCSFRPWATSGEVASVTVEVLRKDEVVRRVDAQRTETGWWAPTDLKKHEVARIAGGGVVDTWGETNGLSYVIAADGSIPAQVVSVGGAVSVDDTAPSTAPISSSRPVIPGAALALALLVLLLIVKKVVW